MVSIIIPTYNAAGTLEPLLTALENQKIPGGKEIIVIDSSSTDGTEELCRSIPSLRFLRIDKRNFNHGLTRNQAAGLAAGDILVFMTQDAVPCDEFFLRNLTMPLRNASVAASYGRQIPRDDATPLEKLTREFNYPEQGCIKSMQDADVLGIKTFFFSNVCSAVKREEFTRMGGFPSQVIIDEDMLFAYRLLLSGKKTAYAADARVFHSHRYPCLTQFRRNFDIGTALKMDGGILQHARAEAEGKRYVFSALRPLLKGRKFGQLFSLCMHSAFKLAGYRLGLQYSRIPLPLRKLFSLNRNYWSRQNQAAMHEKQPA